MPDPRAMQNGVGGGGGGCGEAVNTTENSM